MSYPSTAKQVVLQNYAHGALDLSNGSSATFTVKDIPLPATCPDDSLIVQNLLFSNDPAQKLWFSGPQDDDRTTRRDMQSLPLGASMEAFALSRVVAVGSAASRSSDFKIGDIVESRSSWSNFSVIKQTSAKICKQIPGVPLSAYLGALGLSGATAYVALLGVLKPKQSDTLVVSGAAGAVGNIAVQYAKKSLGVHRVVAIAGSDDKCAWLKRIGADKAVNYKSPSFAEDLTNACPNKIDLFFDNVGGPILNTVLPLMNVHGTIAAVGAISLYASPSSSSALSSTAYMSLILNRLTLSGFTLYDHPSLVSESESKLLEAARNGSLLISVGKEEEAQTVVDVRGKVEELPRVWNWLLEGRNTGKLITKLAD